MRILIVDDDASLPGVDGYEICYLVKSAPELRHTRVIMLAARDEEADVAAGRGVVAVDHAR